MKIFYNSSMPRSGSTLLQNILGQNPDFYVTPTSGLLELIYGAKYNYANSPEFKAQDKALMAKAFTNFCREGIKGYFSAITDKENIIDKSRGWGINYDFINTIFPNAKIVCIVRDLRDVLASMEKNFRKSNVLGINPILNNQEMKGTTIFKRVNVWVNSQPVGLALERISDMIKMGHAKNVLFVKYEDLLTKPNEVMKTIYNHFELPYYQHDWENIPQITEEDDTVYGAYGDHKIQEKLGTLKHNYNEVLGVDVSNYIKNNFKWYFDYFKY